MLQNVIDADVLAQDFTFEFNFLEKYYTINLEREGQDSSEVDEKNKHYFVKQLVYQKLVKSIEAPLKEIRTGICDLLPTAYLNILTPVDLQLMLAGDSAINIAQMKEHTKIGMPAPEQDTIEWFWEVVEEMDKEQQASLLFFITGTTSSSPLS